NGAAHPVFNQTALDGLISDIAADPEYDLLDSLLPLVNMGLLAKMAQTPLQQSRHASDAISLLPEVKIDNWAAQQDNIALQLAIRQKKVQLDCAAALMPGTRLLKMDQNAEESACSYIAVDDKIEYELSEHEMKDWLQVLRRIDGRRSINEILAELGMPPAKIRKHLEEAIDYGIVCFL
ncbi:MAG: hypothetical protein GY862_03075, partial [Gammaproteobacteria bacterium]|nr:hypothetical protein [Gammaproteobacteria bacterium]